MKATFKDPVLGLANDVFSKAGFATEVLQLEGEDEFLRAENELFVVTVASSPTLQGLLQLNGKITSELSRSLSEGIGPKRWDGYLVLVTEERLSDVGSSTNLLFEMTYDTRFVRRIVRAGVGPDLETLQDVLRPFLPLEQRGVAPAEDVLDQMQSELALQGISEKLSQKAIAVFRETESLRNV